MTPVQQQLWVAQRMFAPETPPKVLEEAFAWSIAEAEKGQALTAEQVQAANDALTNFDFREGLRTLNIPTLIISGRHDVLNPPVDGEELERLLPDARLEIFDHSGHMLTLEEPDHLGGVVRTFLREHVGN